MLHATLYEFETPGFRHWDFMVISSEPLREKNGKIAVVMKEDRKKKKILQSALIRAMYLSTVVESFVSKQEERKKHLKQKAGTMSVVYLLCLFLHRPNSIVSIGTRPAPATDWQMNPIAEKNKNELKRMKSFKVIHVQLQKVEITSCCCDGECCVARNDDEWCLVGTVGPRRYPGDAAFWLASHQACCRVAR